jgi:hypothetical protein
MTTVVADVALAGPAGQAGEQEQAGSQRKGSARDRLGALVLGRMFAPTVRDQRGMVTVEWLIGLLVVLAMAGLVIAVIVSGDLNKFVIDFIKFAVTQAKALGS